MKNKKLKGYFYMLISVVMFYLMTVVVKLITNLGNLPGTEVTFFRFLIGLIMINIIRFKNGGEIKAINKKAVFARAILNASAVILFFMTIQLSTTTKANIYNLTYPVFVALFAPFFLKEENFSAKKLFSVALTFFGAYLISGVTFGTVGIADVMGIAMGIVAGLAVIALRKARMTDEPFTILFYLMNVGTLVSGILFFWQFKVPSIRELILLTIMGVVSFGGQFTITKGFKYVTAVEGSLLSASRIFIAAICGALFLGEEFSVHILIGGTLIFASIFLLNSEKNISRKNI